MYFLLDQSPLCIIGKILWPHNEHKLDPKVIDQVTIFVKALSDKVLESKRERGLVLPDEEYTGPNNLWELDKLIEFSFEIINTAWSELFEAMWKVYTPPTLVLFNKKTFCEDLEITRAMWPCYVPDTSKIFIDPLFFEYFRLSIYEGCEDFTIFYIIAHEVAHHVQNSLFWSEIITYEHDWETHERAIHSVLDLRDFSIYHHFDSIHQAEQIVEIHADFLTWVVTHHANKNNPFLHENDIAEGLETAINIWSDIMQLRAWKSLSPEDFQHWRADQRALAFANWLMYGNLHRFSLKELILAFKKQWINNPAHQSVTLFDKLAPKLK